MYLNKIQTWRNVKPEQIPITGSNIEWVRKSLPSNTSLGLDSFTAKFDQTFKEKLVSILVKLFQKIKEEDSLQTHTMRLAILWCKNQTRENQQQHKINKPVSLMNIDVKVLNKILQIEFHQHIKVTHHDQVGFILGMPGWLNKDRQINKCNILHQHNKS